VTPYKPQTIRPIETVNTAKSMETTKTTKITKPAKPIKTVTIVPNIEKSQIPAVVNELASWLAERNVKVLITEADSSKIGKPSLGADETAINASDTVICLGGDGTILRGVRMLKGAPVPIVGVNFGRVGFLTEIEVEEMYPAMERLVAGDYGIDERMMLKCRIKVGDTQMEHYALNEIVIERGFHQRMLEYSVSINDIPFSSYTADGLIFATPTGSTAYSFSAGGPIVSPEHELILLAPISPHSLFGRTMVLGAYDKIRVESPKRLEVAVGVDGFAVLQMTIDSLEIEKADPKAYFIKLKDRSFYTLFKDKLRLWDAWLR
jgi:NAD+ kinase